MPRKSVAELATVRPFPDKRRPEPPQDLGREEAEIWNQVTAGLSADWFQEVAQQKLLSLYCQHCIQARRIAEEVHKTNPHTHLTRYSKLRSLAALETRTILQIATKLRLTNQSRRQPVTAASKTRGGVDHREPWEGIHC